jgi:hypothetical protein
MQKIRINGFLKKKQATLAVPSGGKKFYKRLRIHIYSRKNKILFR